MNPKTFHSSPFTLHHSAGVFDIGSNTVLLTCGKLNAQGQLEVLLERHDVARLSQGLVDGGPLNSDAQERVLKILEQFQHDAQTAGIEKLYAVGTAAFRRASDGGEFAAAIKKQLGIPVQIITGQQEAHYSYQSAVQDFGGGGKSLGMIDIGGGSTELVWGDQPSQWISLPMGTVRLMEKYVSSHPISDQEWKAIQTEIQNTLREFLTERIQKIKVPKQWVAVAATPTALASVLQKLSHYQVEKVHGFKMERSALAPMVERLRTLDLASREQVPGMVPKRAELLPLGGGILLEVMKYWNLQSMIVSHHGLRYGVLWELLNPGLR